MVIIVSYLLLCSCRRNEDAENTPIRLDLKYIGRKEENLAQIRTNPPSPQCFSAKRTVTNTATPTTFKPRAQVHALYHSSYFYLTETYHTIYIQSS